MTVAPVTADVAVVFGLILVAVALFVTEALPPDTTAIAVIVALVVLGDFTRIAPEDALVGFSSPATITIVAMYILSGGVERTGVVRRLGTAVARVTGRSRPRLLAATVVLTGPLAGVVNNTPVVAVFTPMVCDIADRSHVSRSKLLIPLSYASMLGGTLTLIGTATNLVASDLSARLLDHPFTMFEFTGLGIVVFLVGAAYLLTVGQRLLPERVRAIDLTAEFELEPYLWRLFVREGSPLVGATVEEAFAGNGIDLDVLQIVRGDESFVAPGTDQVIEARDRLTVRADEATARAFAEEASLRLLPRAAVTEAELDRPEGRGVLVEAVVRTGSSLVGESIAEATFRERYRATVLAVRHGGDLIHEGLSDLVLDEGDGILLHGAEGTIDHLHERGELVVMEEMGIEALDDGPPLDRRAPLALSILGAVIALAALGLLPIVIAALGGVVAMIVTDVLRPEEAYDAVNWEVIFLLAGVFPLGIALQRTGGAELIGGLIVGAAAVLPVVGVLWLFYLLTGLLANVITPVASVVLMLPIAVDAAARLDANGVAFVLGIAFAASSAFMTPIGYQTNLMVYSPGGYRFVDFVRVGAPLQLLLSAVVTLGIAAFWGV